MELRIIDPRSLIENLDNPRRKSPRDDADAQMEATARAIGILQPPVVREVPKGLMTILGHRRVRGAIAAGMTELRVLVIGADEDADDDRLRALVENIARKAMSPVEQWRAIEKLVSERWTEEAISTALVLPVRTIRKLRLLAHIHAPMLDRMHAGDMPNERELRIIAAADAEEQASVWKANKPKKGERVCWHAVASPLNKARLFARNARFGSDEVAAFNIQWEEDLFAPADEDSRSTTQVDAFMAAQQAWLDANLPERGTVLEVDEYGRPVLPRGAQEHYGSRSPAHLTGHTIDLRTGEIRTVAYSVPGKRRDDDAGRGSPAAGPARTPRASVTAKGVAMIGDLRTDALHRALREQPIGDDQLIGMLVLALGGRNVEVRSGAADRSHGRTARIAEALTEGGALTRDLAILRAVARDMLAYVLSCRENDSKSGMGARIVGAAIGADAFLPNMATPEFLPNLSKAAIEDVAIQVNVPVQPTGKATRGAVIERCRETTYVYPAARFAPTETELLARRDPSTGSPDDEDDNDDPDGTDRNNEPTLDADGEPEDEGAQGDEPDATGNGWPERGHDDLAEAA